MPDETSYSAEAEARAAFESGCAAWNRGDVDAYLAGYWDSEQTRWISGGTVIEGRDAIVATVRARYPTPERMGTLELTQLEITVLTAQDALVFGRLRHMLGDVTRPLVFTVHLRRVGGAWLMVTDHTSTVS